MFKLVAGSTFLTVLVAVILLAIIAGGTFAGFYWERFIAPFRGETEEITTVNRGGYRIAAYERFYDLFEEREANNVKLASYPETLNRREATECRGLVARNANIVSEYNAASRAERTTGQWRAADLPQELEHEATRDCTEGGSVNEED